GMAVQGGGPKPHISTGGGVKQTPLQAKTIAFSASGRGDYLSKEVLPRFGIAQPVVSKNRRIGGGGRGGGGGGRGGAGRGFQQMSELLPVPGIAHMTPLPPAVQKVSLFSAGVAVSTSDTHAAYSVIKFLASPEAANAITKSGLEPITSR